MDGEGKTSIVANLGVVSAQEGKSVLLIDGNLRKPKLHSLFQLPNAMGLSTVLLGKFNLSEAVSSTDIPCLSLLSAGPTPPYPSDLLGSAAMDALLNQCRIHYDLTIIDSPSLLQVSDTEALAHLIDSILIVTRSRYSKKEQLIRARQKLDLYNEKIVGVVVNDRREDD
jgi:capsular exopolysaccharide synthesis family protein